jgi:hypothetical protein
MVGIRKLFIVGFIVIVPGLFLGLGGYKVWSRISVRERPWLLEADLRSRLAECRTGPGSIYFDRELKNLAARAQEAESCLIETDKKIWFRRNYSGCISMIFSAELEARLLSLKLRQRRRNQKRILEALLPSLNRVLSGRDTNGKIWTKLNLSDIEAARTESLLEQAGILHSKGEIEPAFNAVLRAWISWDHFTRKSDTRFARFSDTALRRKWNQQVDKLLQSSKRTGRRAIIVDKFEHLCLLIDRGRVQKRYRADLGRKWDQRKSQAQDASTPEGEYVITRLIPRGRFGQALMINYPNAEDTARFQSLKRKGTIPSYARIGGNIEIHGKGGKESDWTDGCVSLDDDDMQELYRFAYSGMPVTIVGTSRWTSGEKD